MKNYDEEEAIRIVSLCAKQYDNELNNRSLLFVCWDKHKRTSVFEVSFFDRNFLHMTGFKVDQKTLSAKDFYQRCLNGKLSKGDFRFSPDGTTSMKLEVLPSIVKKDLYARMVGDYNQSKPRLYTEKLVGGVYACVGFARDGSTGLYVPNTLLSEDIKNVSKNRLRVVAIFRKKTDNKAFRELVFLANDASIDKLNIQGYVAFDI